MPRKTVARQSYHLDTMAVMRLRDALIIDPKRNALTNSAIQKANALITVMIEIENQRITANDKSHPTNQKTATFQK